MKLEAQYGQLPEFSPAIDDVLEYLKTVCIVYYSFFTTNIELSVFSCAASWFKQ